MKKILTALCIITLVAGSQAFAEETTYTETLLNSLHQNINKKAEPLVNKEKEINAKQKALQDMQQQQIIDRKKQLDTQKNMPQQLINNKKQQIQTQKDLLNQQKNGIKNLFSVE